MNKLIGIINSLNYKELKDIQKDVFEGNLSQLISTRITELEKSLGYDERVCPTCGSKVTEETSKYVLIFGADGFKKRAMFDALDCLTFFTEKLRVQQKTPQTSFK